MQAAGRARSSQAGVSLACALFLLVGCLLRHDALETNRGSRGSQHSNDRAFDDGWVGSSAATADANVSCTHVFAQSCQDIHAIGDVSVTCRSNVT